MKNTLENKEKAIQYLYGGLEKAEQDDFEEKLFTDESLGAFISDIENDLVDEYVRGELEFEQKREFEKKYLTSESRHERVALARTLQNELFDAEKLEAISNGEKTGVWASLVGFFKSPNLALAGGLGALLLLVLLGGIWIASQPDGKNNIAKDDNKNTQDNIAPLKEDTPTPIDIETPKADPETNTNKSVETNSNSIDANANPNASKTNTNKPNLKPTPERIEKKPKENKKPEKSVRKPTAFVASLFPPLRSSQNPVLKIPASVKTVRLQLFDKFGQKYGKFIVELAGSTGTTIWSREIKAAKNRPQKSIGISISEKILKAGTYEIAVKGITKDGDVEEINYYNFVVQKVANQKE